MESLGIVLKITERCNLNCSYCYYFNGIDDSFKKMPPRISKETIQYLIFFLQQGIKDLNLKTISIGFHGGEPLLINKKEFIWICEEFIKEISPLCNLILNIQTNAILIDEEWISIFKKYNIDLGISIDGPKEYNDEHRVDHFGRGSYDRILKSINLVNKFLPEGFGVLSVINPDRDAKKIYRHFVRDLKIKSFDFLFPDNNYSNTMGKKINPLEYGKFICDIFDEWVGDDNPEIKVRFLNSYMQLFLGGDSLIYGIGAEISESIPLISVRSNGNLMPTDELMSTSHTVSYTDCNIKNNTLKNFLEHKVFQEIEVAKINLPKECIECCWGNVCGGGWHSQ